MPDAKRPKLDAKLEGARAHLAVARSGVFVWGFCFVVGALFVVVFCFFFFLGGVIYKFVVGLGFVLFVLFCLIRFCWF